MAFADKVCFVAGGCGTVGSGIVLSLLQEGASVVVNSRSASRLDDLQKRLPADLRPRLTTIQEDCSVLEAVGRIKDFILKEFGRVDHVVTSVGSVWQKGVLTDQSLEEFNANNHSGAGSHFLVAKVFLPYLQDREDSSFLVITGGAGERCFDPNISLLTVRNALLFGVVEAARAQCQGKKVAVLEVRIVLWVQPVDDSTLGDQKTVVGTDFMGRVCTSVIKRRPGEIVRIDSRDTMNRLLNM